MTEAAVLVSTRDLVCEITLNRPEHRLSLIHISEPTRPY